MHGHGQGLSSEHDDLDDMYERDKEQETLQPNPEDPSADHSEYWRGLSTPPQGYSTPQRCVTAPRNDPPQTATPRSRRQGARGNTLPLPLPQVLDPPSPQVLHPPFTQAPLPSRWSRRGPSSSGRMAYMLFGGQGDEPGLYYNWDSLAAVLARYQPQHTPAYMGWNSEEEAVSVCDKYESTGEIPHKLRFNRKVILLNGSHVSENSPSSRPIPQASPIASQANTPPHAWSSPPPSPRQPTSTLSTPTPRRANPASSSAAVSPTAVGGSLYYVVLVGHALGVYNTHSMAARAAGLFMGLVSAASTRAAVNQMFVDGFMTGRVSLSSSDSGR